MKTFLKRAAITAGVLLVALVCMAPVYINNIKHYFTEGGGLVLMFVNTNFVFNVDTNTGSVGWGATNVLGSFEVQGKQRATNATGNGTTAAGSGRINLTAGQGGGTFETTSASGGAGGQINLTAGDGGNAPLATTNATGGQGGTINMFSGSGGGNTGGVATNASIGGAGGAFNLSSGFGGAPNSASTNTVSGASGTFNLVAVDGTTPSAGWARKGGLGGAFNITAGAGGNSTRTNGANGGTITLTAGTGGTAATSGNSGTAGDVSILAGAGNAGTGGGTNSNGGKVFIRGGTPGSGAVPGDIFLGRNPSGTGNGGGVNIGISNSAILTNVMFVRTNLDFPSTLTGASSDLVAVAITGRTNAIVNVGVPPSALVPAGFYTAFCSNGIVFARFTFVGAVSADPLGGDFELEIKAYR